MREILFRGKTITSKEWIYGDLLQYAGGAQIWENTEQGKFNAQIIPETVGQYTGLKDLHGKRIFEGDILSSDKYPYTSDGKRNYFAEVVWFDNCPAFGLYTFKAPKSKVRGISEGSEFIDDNLSDMEVIGNVYDNQGLLEEDKT